ncbi:MAG: 3-methyl-2-oxobutanoate hydroxymethyltransferase [Deltaproteobacteria bacterium]|nr:3-methyl-2-oxobutanoate hydroxymethyltransferase [Deltaproteobacteria bacterium]
MERKKMTPQELREKKKRGEKIVRVVCYDYPIALLADRAEVDGILVGDSVGMVQLGMNGTIPVTMEEMIHHCKAVMRAVKYALVIGDLPFGSYETGQSDAIRSACRLVKEGGVDAVELEGGRGFAPTGKAIVDVGIPVVGHIGLTPQSAAMMGGYKAQGKDAATARKLLEDAEALEQAGAFMLTVECVPYRLGKVMAERLSIPVTGVGAGPYVDGQTINVYDIIGLFDRFVPKHAKKYMNMGAEVLRAMETYKQEVREGIFPKEEHSFTISDEDLEAALRD